MRTPGTSVERLDYINKRELHSSVFSTDKFSELYLGNLVDEDDFKLVWNMATDTRGAYGALYDTGKHQWNSSTTANRYRLTEAQHVSFLKRLEEVVQKQLPGKISSTFASSGNFPLSGGEARCGRKPDIFTVHRDTTKTMKDNRHAWPHVRVVGELKETKEWIGNEDGTNANRQAMVTTLARYVREMFCQPGRR